MAAAVAVPGRDAVAPPDLARDAPILDVPHPVEIGVLPALGAEPDLAVLHCLAGGGGERRRLHEPLRGEIGLDDGLAAIALPDGVAVVLGLDQIALLLQQFGNES